VAHPLTEEVVAAARAGDAAAFRVVYRELGPVVLGYLRARGVADPEAVTSDVFLCVLPRLDDLKGGVSGLRTFVMSVAHARMVDNARRRRRHPVVSEYDVALDPRVTNSAEDEALGSMATAGIVRLLRALPDDQREVLALRFVADLSVDTVASIIGRSSGVRRSPPRTLAGRRDGCDQQLDSVPRRCPRKDRPTGRSEPSVAVRRASAPGPTQPFSPVQPADTFPGTQHAVRAGQPTRRPARPAHHRTGTRKCRDAVGYPPADEQLDG
jgi:RNA polymerase sigma factor (sigma-70 family)